MYNSYYSSSSDLSPIILVLSFAAAIVAMILIVPRKRREKLPKALQVVHDICNFKGLLLEVILKFTYIFMSVAVFLSGFFSLFKGGYNYGLTLLIAVLMMILGPVSIRIVYEIFMMFILLVKNVIQINNKIKDDDTSKSNDPFAVDFSKVKKNQSQQQYNGNPYQQQGYNYQAYNQQPVQQPVQQPAPVDYNKDTVKFCAECGTPLPMSANVCSNCGKPVN